MALPAPPSIPLCIMCARVCTRMLNDQIHWNICGPVFSQNDSGCHVLYITGAAAQLKVYVHICPAARPHCLAHGLAWFHGPESTRPCHWGYLPLTLGQGDTGQGEGKKKSITPTPCPHKNESKLENNMQGPPNTRTLAICWCFLLHTVFAKLPLTACISNETLCPCGEGSKSVPVRTGTISPVWLL